jgi:hypothetical protein
MTEIREISCGVKGCHKKFKEQFYNQGFPDWGHVGGLYLMIDTPAGQVVVDKCYVCPKHKKIIMRVLNGEIDG